MKAAKHVRRDEHSVALTTGPKKSAVVLVAMLAVYAGTVSTYAQEEAPPPPEYGTGLQFTNLANVPIAGLLDRGSYEIDLRMYPEGGLYTFVTIGFLRSVNFGFSYGAGNVIGRGKVDWNPNVEFAFKVRVIPESVVFPAIALGYASQGYGPWLKGADLNRYTVKSPGFYAVASKNYRMLTELGFHFGVNRSREDSDDDSLNLFGGVDLALGPEFYLVLEYDTALNDNADSALGDGNGYLSFGVKWAASPNLRLELFFTNLLDNVHEANVPATFEGIARTLDGAGREIRIVYTDWF